MFHAYFAILEQSLIALCLFFLLWKYIRRYRMGEELFKESEGCLCLDAEKKRTNHSLLYF